ncbi:nucleoside recognition domain-containing protein [Paenibacillus sp. OAS669]|uniref:nucleoside recognition domain-containing protein n=1 Tax=Paenibacillus sp. OAS669 TaxID=2663821 RepID=UPI001789A25A|nr:nucleoside recognition domain-containing protein [Paenibacillus sp. OAS669]MBE1446357.1 sporulation integral membrane protein YlbJ [Paenibacillus sp. OAS669]
MASEKTLTSPRLTTLILGCLALLLVVSIILFPDQAFKSSLQGLRIWWELVFPALLPFFIVIEIARGMGVLHAIGALLEPLLRLLFRLPGIAGWAIAIGITAGTPSGAVAVGSMRKDKLLSRDEAERLLTLSHVASPVFLISVVGVGFLHNAQSGLALAILHYGSALLLALWQRITLAKQHTKLEAEDQRSALPSATGDSGLFRRSASAWRTAQASDGRTFGKLLGDSVTHAVQQTMAIGGLMMMFSVIVHAVSLSQVLTIVGLAISATGIMTPEQAGAMLSSLLPGLFETHLGAYSLGQSQAITDSWQYALLSALFAWGGLSTHAQVKSFTLGTDIRYSAFLKSRLLHAAISFIATSALWKPLNALLGSPAPAWLTFSDPRIDTMKWNYVTMWPLFSKSMLWFGMILLLMLVLSIVTAFVFHHSRRDSKG